MAKRVPRLLWLLVPVALVAAYALVGFLIAPGVATRALVGYVHDTLHRRASVGEVRINPFALTAEIRDLAIADEDDRPMISLARLDVQASLLASISRGGYVVRSVRMDGLDVRVVRRADGTVNLAALSPPPKEPKSATPNVYLDGLALAGASVSLDDLARAQALHVVLKPVAFELRDFHTTGAANAYTLSARTTRGETLAWSGTFGLSPLRSAGRFTIGKFLATTVSEVGLDLLPLDITRGEIDVDGQYRLDAAAATPDVHLEVATFAVRDLGLRARGEAEDWVTVPRLAIAGTTLDLAARTISVGPVRIGQPRITAWRDAAGNLNLAKLYSTRAALPEAAPTDRIEQPWKVRVPRLDIEGLDARIEDRGAGLKEPVRVHVGPADLSVRDFALPFAAPVAVQATLTVNDTGQLSATGPVTLSPVRAKLNLDVQGIDLVFLQPYLDEYSKLDLVHGTVDAHLTVDYAAATGRARAPLSVDGDVALRDVHTRDKLLKLDFVNWNLLALEGVAVRTAPLSIAIREIVANEPYARFVIAADGTTNVGDVLGTGPANATAAPAPPPRTSHPVPAKTGPPVTIRRIRVESGSMNFADQSVRPNFATGIEELSGSITGVSGKPGTHADIALAGKVDRYAPATIAGQMNLLSVGSETDMKVAFRNVELTTFSPYSGKFAGYRVDKGKMSVAFEYHIHDRALKANHHVELDQLELGDRVDSPEATGLPVKLAIALLKDSNGVIDLDLPVSGSLDDPQFRVAPLVWKVVVNLLEKAATAPFKLLGALFGGGPAPEQVQFVPGAADLDEGAAGQIESLRKGLAARPGLKLEIPMAVCGEADAAALSAGVWNDHVRALARARLGAKKGGRPVDDAAIDGLIGDPRAYRALLEDAYVAARGAPPALPAAGADQDPDEAAAAWLEGELRPAVTAAPGAVAALGRARAEAVERALIDGSGVDPARVFIVTDRGTRCDDAAFVAMTLGLK